MADTKVDTKGWVVKCALAQLRGMTKEKLAKTGDSEKWHLLTELTLESRQEAASGKIDGVDATI